jgi:hypothetical protein
MSVGTPSQAIVRALAHFTPNHAVLTCPRGAGVGLRPLVPLGEGFVPNWPSAESVDLTDRRVQPGEGSLPPSSPVWTGVAAGRI